MNAYILAKKLIVRLKQRTDLYAVKSNPERIKEYEEKFGEGTWAIRVRPSPYHHGGYVLVLKNLHVTFIGDPASVEAMLDVV